MSGSTNGLRLVCFDLGGVLIRICRSWEEGCACAGVEVRDPHARERTAMERHQIVVDYQTGRIDCEAFAQSISDILGGLYSPEEVMAVHLAWIRGEYEGVIDTIDAIHRAGLDTACLSNTNHSHWQQIASLPVMQRLRTQLASHELGLHKPDPAIFREAERRLGLTHGIGAEGGAGADSGAGSGGAILFLDDLEENVIAAREAGWNAIHIDHTGRTAEQIIAAVQKHGVEIERAMGTRDH